MRKLSRPWLATLVAGWVALPALAQQASPTLPPPSAAPAAPAPAANAVAATVNGQPILEGALQRGLKRVPPSRHAEARPEILNYLIENTLIDQYLLQMRVAVDPKEVDKKIEQMKAEIQKEKLQYAQVLKDMSLTEPELREHIASDLRWDKYAEAQATDKVLRDMFTANKDMFDGSMVRVRHILLTPNSADVKAVEAAKAQLTAIKKKIEDDTALGLAKVPATATPLEREQVRHKLIEDAFAAFAKEKSACPSKQQGGDVGWFDRAGTMVEPFAKTAFALKPFEISEVITTQFGLHLILLLDKKPGKDAQFEQVKGDVKEVYCDRLRESLVTYLRQRGKIVINPVK
ncbi:MAG: peptidylprolyl isomerase [Planctomycetes bacterium]|nr:peptidylprolyl isomerase [Planctomycetota bacterium]